MKTTGNYKRNVEYTRLVNLGYSKDEAYAKAYSDVYKDKDLPSMLKEQAI